MFYILNFFCSWYLLVYYAIFCPTLNKDFNNDNNNDNDSNNNNNNNNNNNSNSNNNYPVVLKYWVRIRWGIAMPHGQVGIFSLSWWPS